MRPLLNPESRGCGPFGGDILLSLHALVAPSTTNGSAAQRELETRRVCCLQSLILECVIDEAAEPSPNTNLPQIQYR